MLEVVGYLRTETPSGSCATAVKARIATRASVVSLRETIVAVVEYNGLWLWYGGRCEE